MITNEIGRRLRILVIDDREQSVFIRSFSTHVTIEQISSWKQAQGILAKEGRVSGADVLLIDVSMIDDHDIQNAVTKDASVPILPAGPLMALPFIGARAVMSCKVYSAHMQNKDLHKHPYFLLAMGLIAARTELVPNGGALLSRHLCPDASSDLLDKIIKEHARIFHADTESVFAPALDEYRDRLFEMVNRELVTVVNRAEIAAEIKKLRKSLKSETDLRIPEVLKLAIVGDNWSDCISMGSLFADRLHSSVSITAKWLDEIEDWVGKLGPSNLERVLRLIVEQDKEEDDEKPRPLVTAIRDKFYPRLSAPDKQEILRFLILFANAFALDHPDERDSIMHETVYQGLGLKKGQGQNPYMGWFGERDSKKGGTGTKKSGKKGKKGLSQLSAKGDDKFHRCFLSEKSTVLPEDHAAIMRYRFAEGFDEWHVAPYRIVASRS